MLAEPRRKNKYSTDPRGQIWSNDNDKFGQKLMEKMGWTKGKGLGAKLDGNTSHVKVSNKFDSYGVGCSKSYADNWVSHQDDFNALLANLNQKSEIQTDTTQVQKLEEKGKMSKGRLHYQKFTRGKDLSGASNLDMDCIFGRRKSKSASYNPQDQSEASSDGDSAASEPLTNSHGVITTTSTLSVQDYFAQKMETLKQANNKSFENLTENASNNNKRKNDSNEDGFTSISNELVESDHKKSKKKKKVKANINLEEEQKVEAEFCKRKKKTKKSKKQNKETESPNIVQNPESFSKELEGTDKCFALKKEGTVEKDGTADCDKEYVIRKKHKKE